VPHIQKNEIKEDMTKHLNELKENASKQLNEINGNHVEYERGIQ
jgi:hypothetical protein